MDLGCTFPSEEHTYNFLTTCKQLKLHTVAFRGLVSPSSLKKLEALSRTQHGHQLRCLRRADFRLSGNGCLAALAKKLTVSEMRKSGNDRKTDTSNNGEHCPNLLRRGECRELFFEDADLLVLHLDSHSDTSILGDPSFGDLLLASQRETANRRGPNARLIAINIDCFVAPSPPPTSSSKGFAPSYASLIPAPASTFALCKALSKCNDLVFEVTYLPWVRAHSCGELFRVSINVLQAHEMAIVDYENALSKIASRGQKEGEANKARSNTTPTTTNVTIESLPTPPLDPISMLQSIRKASQEIIASYQKPLLVSSGQIYDNSGSNSEATSQLSKVDAELLLMRSPLDVHALTATLTQLRRPLLDQSLAVARRLSKIGDGAAILKALDPSKPSPPHSHSRGQQSNKNQKNNGKSPVSGKNHQEAPSVSNNETQKKGSNKAAKRVREEESSGIHE